MVKNDLKKDPLPDLPEADGASPGPLLESANIEPEGFDYVRLEQDKNLSVERLSIISSEMEDNTARERDIIVEELYRLILEDPIANFDRISEDRMLVQKIVCYLTRAKEASYEKSSYAAKAISFLIARERLPGVGSNAIK